MSDLPRRLRAEALHVDGWEDGETGESVPFADTLREAADEIERLRDVLAEIKKPTYGVEFHTPDDERAEIFSKHLFRVQGLARNALKGG